MKWIKLSLFLVTAINFVAFGVVFVKAPTVKTDPGPFLAAARTQVDQMPDRMPEKGALRSLLRGANDVSRLLVRYYARLEVAFFVFEVANILAFGVLFLALMYTTAPDAPKSGDL